MPAPPGRPHSAALLLAFGAVAVSGCATYDVSRVQNVERVASVWKEGDERKSTAICLEYATAAGQNEEQRAALAVPIGGKQTAELSYQSSATLAQIYTVSDIMQFGHAALYRLCEAAANGMIQSGQYHELVQQTLTGMERMLTIQVSGTTQGAMEQVRAAYRALQAARSELTKLENKGAAVTEAETQRMAELATEIAEKQEAYDKLLEGLGVKALLDEVGEKHAAKP